MPENPQSDVDVIALFLEGAQLVADALADPTVAAAWEKASVLEDQTVGSLAGHLARGAVWVVADYLEAGSPDGPLTFTSAGEYFAAVIDLASPEDHQAIRDRGAAIAAAGPGPLVETVRERLSALGPLLRSLDTDHLISVIAGAVMHLGTYLETRIVEQVVHLDDLARSLDRQPWTLPEEATSRALSIGVDVARRRRGDKAVVRGLYRNGFADKAFPAL